MESFWSRSSTMANPPSKTNQTVLSTSGKNQFGEYSIDGLIGDFRILQYTKGHRYSTDDILVALYAYAHQPNATSVLELGSGIGTIGMLLAHQFKNSEFTTVEAQEMSVALARESLKLNNLETRFRLIHSDFRELPKHLEKKHFSLVVGSPPYFPLTDGVPSSHPQKRACRFEERGTVVDYCSTARPYMDEESKFVFVFPIQPESQRQRALHAIKNADLKLVQEVQVQLKEDKPPLLSLFIACVASSSAPVSTNIQKLIIRKRDSSLTEEYNRLRQSFGLKAH